MCSLLTSRSDFCDLLTWWKCKQIFLVELFRMWLSSPGRTADQLDFKTTFWRTPTVYSASPHHDYEVACYSFFALCNTVHLSCLTVGVASGCKMHKIFYLNRIRQSGLWLEVFRMKSENANALCCVYNLNILFSNHSVYNQNRVNSLIWEEMVLNTS